MKPGRTGVPFAAIANGLVRMKYDTERRFLGPQFVFRLCNDPSVWLYAQYQVLPEDAEGRVLQSENRKEEEEDTKMCSDSQEHLRQLSKASFTLSISHSSSWESART